MTRRRGRRPSVRQLFNRMNVRLCDRVEERFFNGVGVMVRQWLVVLLAVGLLLAACSGDSGPTSTTAGGVEASPTTTEPVPTTTSAPTTTSTTSAPTTTTALAASGGSAECVVGEWELNSDRFVETLAAAFLTEFPDAEVEFREGSYITTLEADGSMSAVRDGWTMAIGTPEGTLLQTIDATETGTYEVDERTSRLSVDLDPGSRQTVTMQVEIDGVIQPLPITPRTVDLPPEASNPSGVFTCSDAELVVTSPQGVIVEFERR